ncbi:hypothetical protein RA280_11720 [Cupriavidus sp. CV2]|uniref:hypothetical protein n=1 Tax=Cupriavidus ulmosensis TaxID=3065913 RepID=UPI00296B0C65|nr:hypothetical protein [Cupriavidus sp. CV2]MDW3682405.1 hypothetical protein [Cupriavidus sp. CV2]
MTAPELETQHDEQLAEELARRQRVILAQSWERLDRTGSTWDLEGVKHLVVLNAAGFAGVATLLAGSKRPAPEWIGPLTLLGFGLGVVLAVLNMYLGTVSFNRIAGETAARNEAIWDVSVNMS